MLGPEAVADTLAARLTLKLPAHLAAVRAARGIAAADLPDPAIIEPHDRWRIPLEEWPAVLVDVTALTRLTPARHSDDNSESYIARYPFRVFLWVRHEDDRDVDLLRKRYVLAVRHVLLSRRTLTDPVPAGGGTVEGFAGEGPVIDPLALTEDYGPLAQDDASRTIAPAYVAADALVIETIDPVTALGVVTTHRVTATAHSPDTADLPPHPAL
jgi:hypothetical protein